MEHLNTDPGIFTTFLIVLTTLILIFLFHLFHFSWIPHPTMVFHCIFLNRDKNRYFRSSLRSSILPQINPGCILKEIYCQISPEIQIWLHYPINLKVTWHKSYINFWHRKRSVQNLVAHFLSKELAHISNYCGIPLDACSFSLD